ncbi:MAG TPA: proton-conducting transporter membrane subunit, partial [Vitreimonas sp.]|nr:proton-conducting transporter membrane subunit [Vitreimonas sp.]
TGAAARPPPSWLAVGRAAQRRRSAPAPSVTLLPFVAIAFAGGCLSLVLRTDSRASAAAGVGGLVAALAAASLIAPEVPVVVGGVPIAGSEFTRLFLLLGSATSLLLLLVASTGRWAPNLPGATLLALGGAGLALGVSEAPTALLAATAASVAGIVATVPGSVPDRSVVVASRELRGLVVAVALGLLAVAIVAGPLVETTATVDGQVVGLAFLALAGGTAIRLGAIPFHRRAARAADAAAEVSLPLVLAWSPAVFAIVALGWVDAAVTPLDAALPVEQVLIVLVAAASIVFGTAAALLHDDLEHVVAYSIVADAGVALLAIAALDPGAWGPARTWLLVLVVGKSGFAAWAAAIRDAYGEHRLTELAGWARRAPLLALALLAVGAASVGWPASAAFEARRALVDLALPGPAGWLLLIASLMSATIYVRLLAAGIRRAGPSVRRSGSWLPVVPPDARPGAGRRGSVAPALWRANRAPVAATAVLLLAALALAVGGGAFGAADAGATRPAPHAGAPD